MRRTILLVLVLSSSCAREPGRLLTGPVDLRRWTAVNYCLVRDDQQYANWVVGQDQRSVTQMENADPSLFVSEGNLDRQTVEGTWLAENHGDDDLIGFVFGYRDPGHFYVFDWKGQSQGGAKRGMSVKIVDVPYVGPASGKLLPGKPFEEHELWNTAGVLGKTRLLPYEDTPGWEFDRPYLFRLDFQPGQFRIVVRDGTKTLYDRIHRDGTYPSGRFGFYNYSQGAVVYKGFETREHPGDAVSPPWLAIAVLLAIIGIIIAHRRRSAAQLSNAPRSQVFMCRVFHLAGLRGSTALNGASGLQS